MLEYVQPVAYFFQSVSNFYLFPCLVGIQYPLFIFTVFLLLFNSMEDLGRLEYRFSIEAKNFLSLLRQGVEGLVPEPRQRLFLYQTLLTKLVMNKAPVDSHKLTMVHAWPNF